jgi:hypothetical protein
MLYAFDLLELDGEDLRDMPLGDRKKRLVGLLGGRRIGIVFSDHTTEDGALLFVHACRMGLEGIVSKRLSASQRAVLQMLATSTRGFALSTVIAAELSSYSGRRRPVVRPPCQRWTKPCSTSNVNPRVTSASRGGVAGTLNRPRPARLRSDFPRRGACSHVSKIKVLSTSKKLLLPWEKSEHPSDAGEHISSHSEKSWDIE